MITTTTKMKVCTGCGLMKPLNRFSPHARRRDGLQTQCKACRAAYIRERRAIEPLLRQRDRAQNNAYNEALRLLRDRHRPEFDRLYADELAKEGL